MVCGTGVSASLLKLVRAALFSLPNLFVHASVQNSTIKTGSYRPDNFYVMTGQFLPAQNFTNIREGGDIALEILVPIVLYPPYLISWLKGFN